MANFDIMAPRETKRHVTIHHGTTGVATLSCDPRCTTVANPTTLGGSSGGSAAPAAPAATPAK